MSDFQSTWNTAELLQHADFVQRLARRLARDEAGAEDLAQETWLAALEGSPAAGSGMRAWLARVLRNRAALRHRRDTRRRDREEATTGVETQSDTTDLVERMELHQKVVGAALDLPEAYREVLLRRYFRGESAAEIARSAGLPEATVRTRMRRGLDRLRDRLRGQLGDDRAAYLAALGRLAAGEGEASRPVDVTPKGSPGPGWSTALPARYLILGSAAAVGLIAIAATWILRGGNDEQPVLDPGSHVASTDPHRLTEVEDADESTIERSIVETSRPTTIEGSVAEDPASGTAMPMEGERSRLTLRVVDRDHLPIADATVTATGLRTFEHRGDWLSWRGEPVIETSGASGFVEIPYPKWIRRSEGDRFDVEAIAFSVNHPDYIVYERGSFPVREGEGVVVLKRGAVVVVSGYLDTPAHTVAGIVPHPGDAWWNVSDSRLVVPHLDGGLDVEDGAWVPTDGGRLECDRYPPGIHALSLSYVDDRGRRYFSEIVELTLEEGERRELNLHLLPARSLRGVIDAVVPRPIVDGEVQLEIYVGIDGEEGPQISSAYSAEVAPDGTFELADLPPGRGEMIGICEGWVSSLVSRRTAAGESDGWLQQVDPSVDDGFVLRMERTASLEVTVLGPRGNPVPEAVVSLSPNVAWSSGGTGLFLDRTWTRTTGADGVALIENLPPEPVELYWVRHPGLRMPEEPATGENARRLGIVELVSGLTTREEIRLEERDGD